VSGKGLASGFLRRLWDRWLAPFRSVIPLLNRPEHFGVPHRGQIVTFDVPHAVAPAMTRHILGDQHGTTGLVAQTPAAKHEITVSGTRFLLDGQPFPWTGVSFFNAICNPTFNKSGEVRLKWLAEFQQYGINVLQIWGARRGERWLTALGGRVPVADGFSRLIDRSRCGRHIFPRWIGKHGLR
jgi:hypothetical protein